EVRELHILVVERLERKIGRLFAEQRIGVVGGARGGRREEQAEDQSGQTADKMAAMHGDSSEKLRPARVGEERDTSQRVCVSPCVKQVTKAGNARLFFHGVSCTLALGLGPAGAPIA